MNLPVCFIKPTGKRGISLYVSMQEDIRISLSPCSASVDELVRTNWSVCSAAPPDNASVKDICDRGIETWRADHGDLNETSYRT